MLGWPHANAVVDVDILRIHAVIMIETLDNNWYEFQVIASLSRIPTAVTMFQI